MDGKAMRDTILTNEQTLLVHDEKQSLTDILLQLSEMNLPKDSLDSLQKATRQLDELFLGNSMLGKAPSSMPSLERRCWRKA
jgi:hypothetical protein